MNPMQDFNHKALITYAEELLRSDETLMALEILEKVPGYYRDNPIPEIQALKREIYAKMATSSFYATHKGCELEFTDEDCLRCFGTLRSILINSDVKICNDHNVIPHIYDMGPGEGALPLILQKESRKFTYEQVYVNEPTYQATRARFKDVEQSADGVKHVINTRPVIFVATEVIEHLHDEREIRYEIERRCVVLPDVVHISTPLYTFNTGVRNWRTIGDLGHLRTYTPRELVMKLEKMFPEYILFYYRSPCQHVRLVRPDTKFEFLKIDYKFDEGQI